MNPSAYWRGSPWPSPWPARVEAFLTACVQHAGQRERDLSAAMDALGGMGSG